MADPRSQMAPGGTFDKLLYAVHSAPEKRLDGLITAISRGHSDGSLCDEAIDRLTDAAQKRREFFRVRRAVGSANRRANAWRVPHPRDDAANKLRTWSTSGALPNSLRWLFTTGESAVAAVVRAEVQRKGRCSLSHRSIAKAAGLKSTTVVKRFMRIAKRHHLIKVQERPQDGGRNLSNVITIVSDQWLSWIAYEGVTTKRGGTNVPAVQSPVVKKERGEQEAPAKGAYERERAAPLRIPEAVSHAEMRVGTCAHPKPGQQFADPPWTALESRGGGWL